MQSETRTDKSGFRFMLEQGGYRFSSSQSFFEIKKAHTSWYNYVLSDPLYDLRESIEYILKHTGDEPNICLMGSKAQSRLFHCPDVLDWYKSILKHRSLSPRDVVEEILGFKGCGILEWGNYADTMKEVELENKGLNVSNMVLIGRSETILNVVLHAAYLLRVDKDE